MNSGESSVCKALPLLFILLAVILRFFQENSRLPVNV